MGHPNLEVGADALEKLVDGFVAGTVIVHDDLREAVFAMI